MFEQRRELTDSRRDVTTSRLCTDASLSLSRSLACSLVNKILSLSPARARTLSLSLGSRNLERVDR